MRKIGLVLAVSTFAWINGCTTESPLTPSADQVVIEAFLYANEPVTDIRVTSTLPLGSDSSYAPPINDAEVVLIKDGIRYPLEPSPGDSGYYHYSGEDLAVETGDKFRVEVDYFNRVAYGETEVPPPPENVRISGDTLVIRKQTFSGPGSFGGGGMMSTDGLVITWEKEDPSLYFVTIENVEPDPEPITTGPGVDIPRKRRFRSVPTARDSFVVNLMHLTHLGRHRARVYRINQEYADLYISRNQNSRDLNEPLTNIRNGLGVFSAFNSDSLFFYVVKE